MTPSPGWSWRPRWLCRCRSGCRPSSASGDHVRQPPASPYHRPVNLCATQREQHHAARRHWSAASPRAQAGRGPPGLLSPATAACPQISPGPCNSFYANELAAESAAWHSCWPARAKAERCLEHPHVHTALPRRLRVARRRPAAPAAAWRRCSPMRARATARCAARLCARRSCRRGGWPARWRGRRSWRPRCGPRSAGAAPASSCSTLPASRRRPSARPRST